ncbi:hypothetical protein IID62_04200 [candidate division KSB1 bacterium]|nr:hypothetical protein [candidate division KSB1 bacterium]
MKTCCFLTLLVILNTILVAQRLVGREIIINPMFTELPSDQRDSLRWMSSVSAWGGFGYYAMGDREHAWYQKLGVLIELFRNGEESNFFFESNIEFIARTDAVLLQGLAVRGGRRHEDNKQQEGGQSRSYK